jgi:hypothetical protein
MPILVAAAVLAEPQVHVKVEIVLGVEEVVELLQHQAA